MPGLGLAGGYGAAAGGNALANIIKQRLVELQAKQENDFRQQQLAQSSSQFGQNLALEREKIANDQANRAAQEAERNRQTQANVIGATIDNAAPGQNLTQMVSGIAPDNQLAKTYMTALRTVKQPSEVTVKPDQPTYLPGTTQYYKPDAVRPPQAQRTQFRDIPAPAGKSGKWQQLYDLDTSKPIGEPSPAYESPTTGQGENDRSYQYTRSKIDTLKAPLAARAERLTRLTDALDSEAPAIDPLIAPELISSMAGGQGTGIRVNQAEIQSAVGGRSHWQELKAALDKWSLDPTKPFLVTPEQRQQIRSLVKLTSSRVGGALKDIDDAGDQLVNAPDVATHRRLYQDLQKKLTTAAQGGESGVAVKPQYDLVLQPDGSYKAVKRGG